MENIVATRFLDIKDLPTTQVSIVDASHTEPNYVLAQVEYAVFDAVTGAPSIQIIQISKTDIMSYRTFLTNERAKLTLRFDNLNAFLAIAGPLIGQWLIDNPNPAEP